MDTYENNPANSEPQAQDSAPETEAPIQPEPQVFFRPAPQSGPVTEPKPWDDRWGTQSYPYRQSEPPVPEEEKPRSGGAWKVLVAAVLVIALVATGCVGTAIWMDWQYEKKTEQLQLAMTQLQTDMKNLKQSMDESMDVLRQEFVDKSHIGSGNSVSGTPNTSPDGLTPAQVYAQNVKSVVAIECTVVTNNYGQSIQGVSSGSGFILTADGYIATNHHVVEGATSLTVTCSDGTSYKARYIGGDASNDIALLKVEATDLQPAKVGRSDALVVGDQVAAIGNPLGELASTLTVGYVSAKDRIISSDGTQINMMQTDAAINPGNSGGPLFNMKGEVVGITTAKYSGSTNSGATIEGIGFAIPIDDVLGMLEDLRDFGFITGAYLGVSVSNMDEDDANRYGLPMGVLVHEVVAGNCAHKAGVQSQDILIGLGGYRIRNVNDLTRALRNFKAGDTIIITVYRHIQGGELQLSITMDAKPQQMP